MAKLSVLLVTRTDKVHLGGTQLSTLMIAKELKAAGHSVHVMCNADHSFSEEFAAAGIPVVPAPLKTTFYSMIADVGVLRRSIVELQIDVVHFQYGFAALMAPFCRNARHAKRVRTAWTCRGIRRPLYPIMGAFANRFIDVVIGNCRQERDKLVQNGVAARKVTFAYNPPAIGIPRDTVKDFELLIELGIDPTARVVGTASRLSPERGVEYFVEAAARVVLQNPTTVFVVAGGGPEEQKLRLLAERLGLGLAVRFLGIRRDMSRVYSIMDIFVNPIPSTYSVAGTGNTTAEAMVCSKAIVTTDAGGIAEMVADGVTGIVVPSRDPVALAAACRRLLDDDELRIRMGVAGRERVLREFTGQHLLAQLERSYSIALSNA